MNFHKSHLQPWGLELVNKYPLIFLEADPQNVPWGVRAGVKEEDYVNLRYGFECGEGWKAHIENIAKKGTEIVCHLRSVGIKDEDAYIHGCIVKEKFGQLRWQGGENLPPLFRDLWYCFTSVEENRSLGTCELTGTYGYLRTKKNGQLAWHRTLCTEKAIELGYDVEERERARAEKKQAIAKAATPTQ